MLEVRLADRELHERQVDLAAPCLREQLLVLLVEHDANHDAGALLLEPAADARDQRAEPATEEADAHGIEVAGGERVKIGLRAREPLADRMCVLPSRSRPRA